MIPNYAGLDYSKRQNTDTDFNCIELCHNDSSCVLAVYYPNNSTCVLQSNVNIFDGMFHSDDSIIFNLFSKYISNCFFS